MSQPNLSDLLNVAIDAAYVGGRRTLAYFNTRVAIDVKADNTPVTVADREAEQVIRERILRAFPDHSILGEEGGIHDGADKRVRWIIDPIDGTKSFVCGVPLYGVLIGVEIEGHAEVGVVYMPALDEMVSAATGFGCRWNGRVARVSEVDRLADAVVCCTSVSSAMKRSDAYETLQSRTKIQRGWGDCYGHILVATGRADIMLDPRMNPWDCAPLLPILREAGGHFTTWGGEATIWGKDAVSTNAKLNREVMEILGAERLKPSW